MNRLEKLVSNVEFLKLENWTLETKVAGNRYANYVSVAETGEDLQTIRPSEDGLVCVRRKNKELEEKITFLASETTLLFRRLVNAGTADNFDQLERTDELGYDADFDACATKIRRNPSLSKISDENIALIEQSFDSDFYIHRYPDIGSAGVDPLIHFLSFGWKERRDPSARFSTREYIARHPVLSHVQINPFLHWLFIENADSRWLNDASGYDVSPESDIERRRRLPGIELLSDDQIAAVFAAFDPEFYRMSYPDIVGDADSCFAHYMRFGWKEGRDPSANFSTVDYLRYFSDLIGLGENPFVHWVTRVGRTSGQSTTSGEEVHEVDRYDKLRSIDEMKSMSDADLETLIAAFDSKYYSERYGDFDDHDSSGLEHYVIVGWREGRDPSPHFSTSYYLSNFPDIVERKLHPFIHWVFFGRGEGRPGTEAEDGNNGYASRNARLRRITSLQEGLAHRRAGLRGPGARARREAPKPRTLHVRIASRVCRDAGATRRASPGTVVSHGQRPTLPPVHDHPWRRAGNGTCVQVDDRRAAALPPLEQCQCASWSDTATVPSGETDVRGREQPIRRCLHPCGTLHCDPCNAHALTPVDVVDPSLSLRIAKRSSLKKAKIAVACKACRRDASHVA